MAYVLGFFAADGCLTINPRGAHYLDFMSTDLDVLFKIRRVMRSQHKIACYQRKNPNWKAIHRLQIGSKYIFSRIEQLGFSVNKSLILTFPHIPNKFLSHFVRGYFDGDGLIVRYQYHRKDRNNKIQTYVQSGFTCGSEKFLIELFDRPKQHKVISGGCLCRRNNWWDLKFASKDTVHLCYWMYQDHHGLYLDRKYQVFQKILGDVV